MGAGSVKRANLGLKDRGGGGGYLHLQEYNSLRGVPDTQQSLPRT